MHYICFSTKQAAIRFEQELIEEGLIYTSIEPTIDGGWAVCFEEDYL